MKKSLLSAAIAATLASLGTTAQAGLLDGATQAWTYQHSGTNSYLSEILSFDAARNELWVSGVSGIDILNAASGDLVQRLDISAFGSVNSVSIHGGVAALAIENKTNRELPGLVQTYNTATRSLTGSYTVGALPDMLTFTKDGSKILVANEATPNNVSMAGISAANSHYGTLTSAAGVFPRTYGTNALDPAGSVSIINLGTGVVTTSGNLNTALRTGSNLRTNTGMDFEPEYIAVNAAGTKAYVTLQEANGMGVLDIAKCLYDAIAVLEKVQGTEEAAPAMTDVMTAAMKKMTNGRGTNKAQVKAMQAMMTEDMQIYKAFVENESFRDWVKSNVFRWTHEHRPGASA